MQRSPRFFEPHLFFSEVLHLPAESLPGNQVPLGDPCQTEVQGPITERPVPRAIEGLDAVPLQVESASFLEV